MNISATRNPPMGSIANNNMVTSRDQEWDHLKKELRSIALSVGPTVYVSVEQLDRDYADLNGHPIRYYDFGFNNLYDMLAAMADSVALMDCGEGQMAVVPISDKKTIHLENLIAFQKPAEPTRFGGMVPGLDNKEQNRNQRGRQQQQQASGYRGASRSTRGRSENRRGVGDELLLPPKRPVSVVDSSTVFQTPPTSLANMLPPKYTASRSFTPKTRTRASNDQNLSKPGPLDRRVSYSREDLMQIRATTPPIVPEYLYHSGKCSDYPDMEFIEFVVHNILELVRNEPNGLTLDNLKVLYAEFFPNEPPLSLIENLGISLEDFLSGNVTDEIRLWKNMRNETVVSFVDKNVEPKILSLVDPYSSLVTPSPTLKVDLDSDLDESFDEELPRALEATKHLQKFFPGNLPVAISPKIAQSPQDFCLSSQEIDPNIDLISLDDDPAVVAFERRPASSCTTQPGFDDSILRHSPLMMRPQHVEEASEIELTMLGSEDEEEEDELTPSCNEERSSTIEADRMTIMTSASTSGSRGLIEYSDKAPKLDKTRFHDGVKISYLLWENIYQILRVYPEGIEHADLMVEYARRYQQTLGGNLIAEKCSGVKTLRDMLFEISYVEPFTNAKSTISYRLRRTQGQGLTVRDKEERAKQASKSLPPPPPIPPPSSQYMVGRSLSDEEPDEDDDLLDEDPGFEVPEQPREYLVDQRGRISLDIRARVYRLLRARFQRGIDLQTFMEQYSKVYKGSINAQTMCKLTNDQVFRSMKDILQMGEAPGGKVWVKPKTPNEIKELYSTIRPQKPGPTPREMLKQKTLNVDKPTYPLMPEVMPYEVRERLRMLIGPSGSHGIVLQNFENLYSEKYFVEWFRLFGYVNIDQLIRGAGDELDVFMASTGERRIRLKRFVPVSNDVRAS